jgi:hypothetical protein
VPQELAQRNRAPLGDEAGEALGDGVVERELVLRRELQNDGCDEGLRDAPDAEVIAGIRRLFGRQIGVAARHDCRPRVIAHIDDHARAARRDNCVGSGGEPRWGLGVDVAVGARSD